jgi:hypothetical protein
MMKKIKKNVAVELYLKTLKRQGTKIQGPLHPAKAKVGYFLA